MARTRTRDVPKPVLPIKETDEVRLGIAFEGWRDSQDEYRKARARGDEVVAGLWEDMATKWTEFVEVGRAIGLFTD